MTRTLPFSKTTMSSILTPPQPGMYMPGSMVNTMSLPEYAAAPRPDYRNFVDGQADAVAEGVAEGVRRSRRHR